MRGVHTQGLRVRLSQLPEDLGSTGDKETAEGQEIPEKGGYLSFFT